MKFCGQWVVTNKSDECHLQGQAYAFSNVIVYAAFPGLLPGYDVPTGGLKSLTG